MTKNKQELEKRIKLIMAQRDEALATFAHVETEEAAAMRQRIELQCAMRIAMEKYRTKHAPTEPELLEAIWAAIADLLDVVLRREFPDDPVQRAVRLAGNVQTFIGFGLENGFLRHPTANAAHAAVEQAMRTNVPGLIGLDGKPIRKH